MKKKIRSLISIVMCVILLLGNVSWAADITIPPDVMAKAIKVLGSLEAVWAQMAISGTVQSGDRVKMQGADGSQTYISGNQTTQTINYTPPEDTYTYDLAASELQTKNGRNMTQEEINSAVINAAIANPSKFGATVTTKTENGKTVTEVNMYGKDGPITLTQEKEVSSEALGFAFNLTEGHVTSHYQETGGISNLTAVASGMSGYGSEGVILTDEEAAAYLEQIKNAYKEQGKDVEVSFIDGQRAYPCNNDPENSSLIAAVSIKEVSTNTSVTRHPVEPQTITTTNVNIQFVTPPPTAIPTGTPTQTPTPTPTQTPPPTQTPTLTQTPGPPPPPQSRTTESSKPIYELERKKNTSNTDHVTANLSPDRTNYAKKEKLYMLGDLLTLSGTSCVHTIEDIEECTQNSMEITTYDYLEYAGGYTTPLEQRDTPSYQTNGVEVLVPVGNLESLNSEGRAYIESVKINERGVIDYLNDGYSWDELNLTEILKQGEKRTLSKEKESHKVYIELTGFEIDGKNKFSCLEDKEIGINASKPTWQINGKITKVNGKYENGVQKGIIKVYCKCGENGAECCNKTFNLYFERRDGTEKPVDLTVKSSPEAGGYFKISGPEWNSISETFEYKEKDWSTELAIKAKFNGGYKIEPKANSGYEYKRIVTRDGNVVSEVDGEDQGNVVDYIMQSPIPITLFVYFEGPSSNGHKVTYVVDPSKDGNTHGTIIGENPLINMATGAELPLNEKVTIDHGYDVSRWYFKDKDGNIITPDTDGKNYFIMPDYDVVVHVELEKSEYVNLTVKIIPEEYSSVGAAMVWLNNDIARINQPNQVKKGSNINLSVLEASGYKFIDWEYENEEVISKERNINYQIYEDTTIVVKLAQPYTLYVTSTEGGDAWADYNSQRYYKIELLEGTEIDIECSIDEGYTLKKWEYSPYITEKTEGNNKTRIIMPASDITVTAIFEKNKISNMPKLKVTTNNSEWGIASTTIGRRTTQIDEEYEVEANTILDLEYKAKEGYYFVKWQYTTSLSPFIDIDQIIMPNRDLEVMAIFAPIPPNKGGETYKVDFQAEPLEGGSVPEDLNEISAGSKVTIGVTPNIGWRFAYWYFKDDSGNIKHIPVHFETDGSGYFTMPNYNVKAIAHFKRDGTYKLYVTHTKGGDAWTKDIINNPEYTTTYIEKAIPEMLYPLYYEVEDGYEFDGWEYRWAEYGADTRIDRNIDGVDKVIMPYSDLTVTAKFKEVNPPNDGYPNDGYKLRVTSNNYLWGDAWVRVDGRRNYSWKDGNNPNANNEEGIELEPDKEYEVYFRINPGYEFTNWGWTPDNGDYFIDRNDNANGYINTSEGEEVEPGEIEVVSSDGFYNGYGKIKIPTDSLKSDIELMAYFKPGETENVDTEYNLTVEVAPEEAGTISGAGEYKEGEEYIVSVNLEDGYEIEYWKYTLDNGDEYTVGVDENDRYKIVGEMPQGNLTITAICEENDEEGDYRLTVKVDPREAGTVSGTGRYMEGEEYTVDVDVRPGYEIKNWKYTFDNGDEYTVDVDENDRYKIEGIMPPDNLTITAICEPDTIKYELRVIVIGNGTVKDSDGNTVTTREMYDGESILLKANPNTGNSFAGWWIKGERYSMSLNQTFTSDGEDLVIYAYFVEDLPTQSNDIFKIISVRDLNWKDYFVNANGTVTGKYFGVPQSGSMLKTVGRYLDVIKMGYAVEFELTTSHVDPNKAVLIITPQLYDGEAPRAGETKAPIEWSGVKDYMADPNGNQGIGPEFKKIVIYGDENKASAKAKVDRAKFQTKVKVDTSIKNNGEPINQITWNWLYYLPADIGYPRYNISGEDKLTVRFHIQVHELNSEGQYSEPTLISNGTLKENIVVFEQEYNGVSWKGDVYKYSKEHSLLEDIYNNATN